jgi:hypothetical protein
VLVSHANHCISERGPRGLAGLAEQACKSRKSPLIALRTEALENVNELTASDQSLDNWSVTESRARSGLDDA